MVGERLRLTFGAWVAESLDAFDPTNHLNDNTRVRVKARVSVRVKARA